MGCEFVTIKGGWPPGRARCFEILVFRTQAHKHPRPSCRRRGGKIVGSGTPSTRYPDSSKESSAASVQFSITSPSHLPDSERFLEITEYVWPTSRQLYPDASGVYAASGTFRLRQIAFADFQNPVVNASGRARRTFKCTVLSPSRMVRIGSWVCSVFFPFFFTNFPRPGPSVRLNCRRYESDRLLASELFG